MNALYLVAIILGISGQDIVKKPYLRKTGGKGIYVFGLITGVTAMLFFVVTSRSLTFDVRVLPYAAAFAVSYAVSTVASVAAVSCGSLSLTSLIVSYSLMLPTVYGLVFLHDPIGVGLIPGLVLLGASLILINRKDKSIRFSLRWVISVTLAFLGNGMCSVVQKMEQVRFDGAYKNELMIEALLIVTLLVLVMSLKEEHKDLGQYIKSSWYYGVISGVLNGMVNLFAMVLCGRMPVSLMFPLISAGGIIVTYLVSRFLYKEKLTKTQFAGFFLGIVAVALLNV